MNPETITEIEKIMEQLFPVPVLAAVQAEKRAQAFTPTPCRAIRE